MYVIMSETFIKIDSLYYRTQIRNRPFPIY